MGKSWSTADWLALSFVDFLLFHARPTLRADASSILDSARRVYTTTKTSKSAVFWMQITDYGTCQDFRKQSGNVQHYFGRLGYRKRSQLFYENK